MKLGKALAMTAMTGMIAGLASTTTTACGGEQKADPNTPSTNTAVPTDRNCCKGKNECANKSGCKTDTNPSCAGQNSCAHKGTSCPKA